MLLNIISGGPGSGKSAKLYGLIRQNMKNNPGSNAVLIVPEQFSYNAERALSAEMGGLGLNGVEVLTFSRLVHRYVDASKNILPSGKMMLICKAAAALPEDNSFFCSVKKPGFLSSAGELFSEFKRYCITPDDLDAVSLASPAAEKKLRSACELYKGYLSLFDGDFTDGDDALELFAEFVRSSGTFRNTFFFIDDYNDFLPQHLSVIRALISASRGVHITLGIGSGDPDSIFAPVLKTRSALSAIALSEGAQLCSTRADGRADYAAAPDIGFLVNNWGNRAVYDGKCENIELFTARDLYSEVEHTASAIISAVRDKGLRFRDIGVICGGIDRYLHILNAVFADYKIPFFTDEKLAVSMHPVAKTVLALFEITAENWSYNAVFDYLRGGCIYVKTDSGVAPLDPEELDLLENYVLAQGIKGKKRWFTEWTECGETVFDDVLESYRRPEYDLELLNRLRRTITAPFEAFFDNRGRTVSALCTAVYDFMCSINLYEGILYECEQLDSMGMRDEAEQYKQVWNAVLEVLDQMVISLGKGAVSREAFSEYFKNGLSVCQLSIIPSGLDRVSIGTVERNAPPHVKMLFIIGATYGAIPAVGSSSPILSDADRALLTSALSERDKELAPDNANRLMRENLKLYRICAAVSEKLYISFPAADSEGNSLAGAHFTAELTEMFPDMAHTDNVISRPSNEELLASSKRGFYYMLSRLSEYYNEKPSALWQSVYSWYARRPEYQGRLKILEAAAKYKRVQPRLSRLKAQLLYGTGKKYSITALEKFSKCPFSYYAERGLGAREQEVRRVEKSHIGSLIHAAVCEFCRAVENGAGSIAEIHERWLALTPERCGELVHSVMAAISEKILARTGAERSQIEYLLARCERTLKRSVETIRKSLSAGGYTSICYEKDFEVSIDWQKESVTLFGTIDRIDIMEKAAEGKAYIRIVDYKSGHKKFSVAAICSKIDMQLVLYAAAAVKLYGDGRLRGDTGGLTPQVSAILYNRLNDDFVKLDENNPELAAAEHKKNGKLDGLIILDENAEDGTLGQDILRDMDEGFGESGSSDFLRTSLKKDGNFASGSQVASRADFDIISDYIKKSVIDADKSIKDGNISISPLKDGEFSSCTYCKFREICMFDSGLDKYRFAMKDSGRAIEEMKKEVRPDEHEMD